MTTEMTLKREVVGKRGSVRLYQCQLGLAIVMKVRDGETEIISFERHENAALPALTRYMDNVEQGLEETAARRKTNTVVAEAPKVEQARAIG